jgi:hypothetical protein
VMVQLTQEQLAAKKLDGTSDFLTLGDPDKMGLLRDDGQDPDLSAGDGLYAGFAQVDLDDLKRRGSEDQAAYDSQPATSRLIPLFQGRAAVDVVEPVPFDYAGFEAGRMVRLAPAVAFLEPESETDTDEPGTVVVGAASRSGSQDAPRLLTSRISSPTPVTLGTNPFQRKVLMIKNPAVVADPTRTWDPCTNTGAANGVWTFNHLMTQMANTPLTGVPAPDFVNFWLQHWLQNLTINQDPVAARAVMNSIISQWPKVNGKLDLTKSPLRLLAIVPRLDLRKTTGGGGPYSPSSGNFLDAGEARFIFGFVAKKTTTFDPATAFTGAAQINNSACFALPFTVIFEYKVPKSSCVDVRQWARDWKSLSTKTPGSFAYNSALQALTQQFVLANTSPLRPNGSSLGQLRTNEVALAAPWELREFRLGPAATSLLNETTVEDTIRNDPGSDYNNNANGTGLLKSYIQTVVKPLLVFNREAPIPLIPLLYLGSTFQAGDSRVPEANPALITFHWNAPGLNVATDNVENWARHRVSRAACNGCHRREVFTPFVHVNPSNIGGNPALPAELSVFLTGINGLGDPATSTNPSNPNLGTPKRNFDDLARREVDIKQVAGISCSGMPLINVQNVRASLMQTGRLPVSLFEGQDTPTQSLSLAIDDILRNPVFEVH